MMCGQSARTSPARACRILPSPARQRPWPTGPGGSVSPRGWPAGLAEAPRRARRKARRAPVFIRQSFDDRAVRAVVAMAMIRERWGAEAIAAVLPSDHLVRSEAQFASTLEAAAAEADKGVFISSEAMMGWVKDLFDGKKRPPPQPDVGPPRDRAARSGPAAPRVGGVDRSKESAGRTTSRGCGRWSRRIPSRCSRRN